MICIVSNYISLTWYSWSFWISWVVRTKFI